jgi:hypothetical protein
VTVSVFVSRNVEYTDAVLILRCKHVELHSLFVEGFLGIFLGFSCKKKKKKRLHQLNCFRSVIIIKFPEQHFEAIYLSFQCLYFLLLRPFCRLRVTFRISLFLSPLTKLVSSSSSTFHHNKVRSEERFGE